MNREELAALLSQMDKEYTPFPAFSDWANLKIDVEKWLKRWEKFQAAKGRTTPEIWERATEYAFRAAAVDTGALEGLYQTNRGVTYSIATYGFAVDLSAQKALETFKDFFEAQTLGYKLTIDAIKEKTPISEAWIRSLHEVLTSGQETYWAITLDGEKIEKKLTRGAYKTEPNHVLDATGKPKFSYAPVKEVGPEMERLLGEIRSDSFQGAHPILQAAYAHYAFVRIHPFTDGNGRVARALASLFFTKGASIPLVIFVEQRDEYLDALEKADTGEFQRLIDFMFERAIETFDLVETFTQAASFSPAAESIARVKRLFIGQGGLAHGELDQIARQLLDIARARIADELDAHKTSQISLQAVSSQMRPSKAPAGYRPLVGTEAPKIEVVARTRAPAAANVSMQIKVFVATGDDRPDILLTDPSGKHRLETDVVDVNSPKRNGLSVGLDMKLKAWSIGIVNEMLSELLLVADESFKASPYYTKQ